MNTAFLPSTGGVSLGGRVITLLCGIILAYWSFSKLRDRRVLVSTCSIFISIAAGLILFGLFPDFFDAVARAAGVKYPPLFYLVITVIVFLVLNVHLAARLSIIDRRCRRVVQELAISVARLDAGSGAIGSSEQAPIRQGTGLSPAEARTPPETRPASAR
ncbi:MAG: DUF2304 domain-containing protein [Bryobacteraceae bacterium]|jgi:hypothetical protein